MCVKGKSPLFAFVFRRSEYSFSYRYTFHSLKMRFVLILHTSTGYRNLSEEYWAVGNQLHLLDLVYPRCSTEITLSTCSLFCCSLRRDVTKWMRCLFSPHGFSQKQMKSHALHTLRLFWSFRNGDHHRKLPQIAVSEYACYIDERVPTSSSLNHSHRHLHLKLMRNRRLIGLWTAWYHHIKVNNLLSMITVWYNLRYDAIIQVFLEKHSDRRHHLMIGSLDMSP
jgi:hypothetical protein